MWQSCETMLKIALTILKDKAYFSQLNENFEMDETEYDFLFF